MVSTSLADGCSRACGARRGVAPRSTRSCSGSATTIARRITLQLRLHSAGDCDYELVRPYWLALDAANDYEITFEVLP